VFATFFSSDVRNPVLPVTATRRAAIFLHAGTPRNAYFIVRRNDVACWPVSIRQRSDFTSRKSRCDPCFNAKVDQGVVVRKSAFTFCAASALGS
jgi:hypothetical protein